MAYITDKELDALSGWTDVLSPNIPFPLFSIFIHGLIAEVREYRRRAMTDGRYDNELVIAADERPRHLTYGEWWGLSASGECRHKDHTDCGPGWVYP